MLEELKSIVGAENVFKDEGTLKHYSSDLSLNPPKSPSVVVKPQNSKEVQELVKLANKTLTPIIPVSSGIHFGGATILEQGGIVVDLGRMNKILQIDVRNRKVKIEPGVTWPKLQEALKPHEQMALNPLCPHPKMSALTSSLEREPMLIPKHEYSEPVLTMEVVLPSGKLFKTGSAAAAKTEEAYPEGPGLDFFRFFQGAQGTLGIVTWLNIKTEYRPRHQKVFFIPLKKLSDAADPIYSMQRKHIGNECLVLNKFLLALLLSSDGGEDFDKLMDELPEYTIIVVVAGCRRRPLERIEYEEDALMEVASNFHIEAKRTLAGIPGLEATIIQKFRELPQNGDYWKTSFKNSMQDIFFITTMDRALEFVDLVVGYAPLYGISMREMGIYMQPLERGRACHLSFSFPCDLDSDKEREKIRRFYLDVSEKLHNAGAFFSRPYGPWAEMVYRGTTSNTIILKEIKKVFDPNNILNPGKLCF